MTSYRLTGPLRGTDLVEAWIVDGAIRHSAPDGPAQTVAGWAYPGLVDAHAHPGLSHSAEPVADAEVIRRLDAARAAGVTTVREMGAQLDVARFAARGRTKTIRSGRHIARPKRYIRNVAAEIEPGELPDEVVRQAARGLAHDLVWKLPRLDLRSYVSNVAFGPGDVPSGPDCLRSASRREAGDVELRAHFAHRRHSGRTRRVKPSDHLGVGDGLGGMGQARVRVGIDQARIGPARYGLRRAIGRAVADRAVDDPRLDQIGSSQRPRQAI